MSKPWTRFMDWYLQVSVFGRSSGPVAFRKHAPGLADRGSVLRAAGYSYYAPGVRVLPPSVLDLSERD
jgi:hypothetical protein